ncbi:lipo-like protein [Phreatobacter sp. AB_2022a]|uniref:lipo-like protein n=1 Tax=Phreatobacter sp. AB_2022a TaxID=3003134 RepID=UPI002287314E|nr:lipo-like protein [Phreatobacter sp. AB_2022a]MCZ0735072.1 lipo-like protein [Phreatobacter sp. AB_2022a]
MGERLLETLGRHLAHVLDKRSPGYEPTTPSDPAALCATLRPADILLVEGDTRISAVIKYLTQSTWSHAAMYVGPIAGRREPDGEPHVLIEAYLGEGVISAPLSKYRDFHTRICRPVGLTGEDQARVTRFMIERIGLDYDLKNILDMLRFLVPLPVPVRWRRRLLAFGSGDPTRAICSTLIAQAFEAVRYPILPKVERLAHDGEQRVRGRAARREILHIRHHSLYAPRDFDISPYFAVVKPTLLRGFKYKKLQWGDVPAATAPIAPPEPMAGFARQVSDGQTRRQLLTAARAS